MTSRTCSFSDRITASLALSRFYIIFRIPHSAFRTDFPPHGLDLVCSFDSAVGSLPSFRNGYFSDRILWAQSVAEQGSFSATAGRRSFNRGPALPLSFSVFLAIVSAWSLHRSAVPSLGMGRQFRTRHIAFVAPSTSVPPDSLRHSDIRVAVVRRG